MVTVREELRTEIARMVGYRDVRTEPPTIEICDVQPAETPLDLVAVDGSYSFLLNLGSMWLAIARAAAIPFVLTERGFPPRAPTIVDKAIMVSTWEDIVAKQDEFHQRLFEATRGSSEQHKEMGNEFRKHLEGELALKVARETKGVAIALDGSLSAVPKELDHLEDVVEACEKNGNVLVGVSKDSFLPAFGRSLPDEQFLQSCGGVRSIRVRKPLGSPPRGRWASPGYCARLHAQA